MQEVMKIEGGHELEGEITISGAKNMIEALSNSPIVVT